MARIVGLLAALALLTASCGTPKLAQQPVTGREWRAVVDDWLSHGRFAQSRSCAAVVVARSRVVPRYHEGTPLVHALDLEERQLCTVGDVWAVKVVMSDREVASIAGAPIPWLSGPHCWSYHASKPGTSIDGLRFCFTSGRVSKIQTAVHG